MEEIINSTVFEFDFETFVVKYEDSRWFAEHKDEEIEELIIIQDPSKAVYFDTELELFEGFVLTKGLFDIYQKIADNK